jgi:putative transposase
MKRRRFTEEQIIGILREQEAGAKTEDLAWKR